MCNKKVCSNAHEPSNCRTPYCIYNQITSFNTLYTELLCLKQCKGFFGEVFLSFVGWDDG